MVLTATIVVAAHERAMRMADMKSATPFTNGFDLPELHALERPSAAALALAN
jgi:hypothetical protein